MPDKTELVSEVARRFPALAEELGTRDLEFLVNSTSLVELPAGRKIMRDRMPVDSLYLLLEGEAAISVEESGKAIRLGRAGPGQWLGEVSVLSGELLASSTVESETRVRLLRMRHEKFEELIASNHELGNVLLRQFVSMLAERLRTSSRSFQETARSDSPAADLGPEDDAPAKPGKNWIKSFFERVQRP